MHNYTIALLGAAGVGKTAYIRRFLTGEWTELPIEPGVKHIWTVRCGPCVFTIHELDIQSDMDLMNYDGIIVMFSVTDMESYNMIVAKIDYWNLTKPVVICGNKCDVVERVVRAPTITVARLAEKYYCDLSAKSNYNFEKPFVHLIRKLTGDYAFHFI